MAEAGAWIDPETPVAETLNYQITVLKHEDRILKIASNSGMSEFFGGDEKKMLRSLRRSIIAMDAIISKLAVPEYHDKWAEFKDKMDYSNVGSNEIDREKYYDTLMEFHKYQVGLGFGRAGIFPSINRPIVINPRAGSNESSTQMAEVLSDD